MLKMLHHVVYRCRDAAETAEFYKNVLGLPLKAAMSAEFIPSKKINVPHNHLFFEMKDGSYIAFFDIANDTNPVVPVENDWAQHLALEVENMEIAEAVLARLRERGSEYWGPILHGGLITSWYFYDPNGHRLEIVLRTDRDDLWQAAADSAETDLAAWTQKKHAAKAPLPVS